MRVQKRNSVLVRYRQHGVEHQVEARCVVLATPATVSHRVGVNLDSDVREALSKIVYGPYVSAAFLTNETERQVWDDAYAIATPKRSFNVALNMSNIARGFEAERRPGSSIMTFSPASLARGLLELDDDEIRKIYIGELDQVLPNFAQHVVEAEIQRWPTGAPYCFPGRGKLQPALTRKGGRVLLAGDYLGTLYTETAIHTGLSAAQEAQSLLATDRQGVRHLSRRPSRDARPSRTPRVDDVDHTPVPALPTLGDDEMTAQLSGVLTALVTPFTSSGQVDEENLRRLVDRNIQGGVDGVVACGSTGEFAAMSAAERRFVVETVIDQAAGRVPVVAQTGAVSTAEAVELSRHAEEAGASVLMVVTPYYEPLTLDETLRYLRTVSDAVDIPIMLYNLPVATGVNLAPATVGELAREVDNIQYIKDTSADMAQAGQLIHNYGDVVSTFVGWDSLLLAALSEGAAGVMAGTANVMAAELVSIHRALAEGDLNRARAEWEQIYPLMDAIMNAPFIPAVKAALNALGFPAGSPREPFLDLDPTTAATISSLAAALPQPAPAL
jgi:4-hydroxy-tetrahydrodipicolinate synthase